MEQKPKYFASFFKKERMNYETETFSCHWRIDCYSLVTLLAVGGRRYERLADR